MPALGRGPPGDSSWQCLSKRCHPGRPGLAPDYPEHFRKSASGVITRASESLCDRPHRDRSGPLPARCARLMGPLHSTRRGNCLHTARVVRVWLRRPPPGSTLMHGQPARHRGGHGALLQPRGSGYRRQSNRYCNQDLLWGRLRPGSPPGFAACPIPRYSRRRASPTGVCHRRRHAIAASIFRANGFGW